jgi:hypothetical protein
MGQFLKKVFKNLKSFLLVFCCNYLFACSLNLKSNLEEKSTMIYLIWPIFLNLKFLEIEMKFLRTNTEKSFTSEAQVNPFVLKCLGSRSTFTATAQVFNCHNPS